MTDVMAMIELSKELAKAKGLLPKHAQDPATILAVILAGAELGWGPMASLRSLQLVSGKLTLTADAMLGLVVKAGVQIRWDQDGSAGVATLSLKRGDMAHVQSFSREDAKRANLNSQTWKSYEPAMLRARCVSAAVRAFCPDVLNGAYLPGELPDDARQEGAYEPKAADGKRTLDDVAINHAGPMSVGVLGGINPHCAPVIPSARDEATVVVAKQAIVADNDLFQQHMKDLAVCAPEGFGMWFESLRSMTLTATQKRAAWELFTTRCAAYEIDSNQFKETK